MKRTISFIQIIVHYKLNSYIKHNYCISEIIFGTVILVACILQIII